MKYFIFILIYLFCIEALAGFPPTTSKVSSDTNNVTTFNYQFPNFTGTHTGVTVSLGVNGVAGGGTGAGSFTAHDVLLGNGSSAFTPITPSTANSILISNGTSADPSFQQNIVLANLPVAVTWPTTGTVFSGAPATHDVLISGSGTTVTMISPGTSGLVLTSNGTSADPTFQAVGGASVSTPTGVTLLHFVVEFGSGASYGAGICTTVGACTLYEKSTAPASVSVTGSNTGTFILAITSGCTGPLHCDLKGYQGGQIPNCVSNESAPSGTVVAPTNISATMGCFSAGGSAINVGGQITCDCLK